MAISCVVCMIELILLIFLCICANDSSFSFSRRLSSQQSKPSWSASSSGSPVGSGSDCRRTVWKSCAIFCRSYLNWLRAIMSRLAMSGFRQPSSHWRSISSMRDTLRSSWVSRVSAYTDLPQRASCPMRSPVLRKSLRAVMMASMEDWRVISILIQSEELIY